MSLFVLPNIECCECRQDWFDEGDAVYFRDRQDGESEILCEECSHPGDRSAVVRGPGGESELSHRTVVLPARPGGRATSFSFRLAILLDVRPVGP